MISVQDAFRKFKSNLELTQGEQDDASRRQQEIREAMDEAFAIEDDFLTGSYKRWTKTKPLQDVDIFCVLKDNERHYRDEPSSVILTDVEKVLVKKYGRDKVDRPVAFGIEGFERVCAGLLCGDAHVNVAGALEVASGEVPADR